MNDRIKKLFTCVHDNKVVAFDTNFKDFCNQFRNLEPDSRSCRWLNDRINSIEPFEYEVNGKKYYFQSLI